MDPYEILGVSRDADKDVIDRAFKRLAQQSHPDRGGDKEKFQLVAASKAILSDPKRKEHFDRTGKDLPTDPAALLVQEIVVLVLNTIDSSDTTYENVLDKVKTIVRASASQHADDVVTIKAKLDKGRKALARITRKKGSTRMLDMMEHLIEKENLKVMEKLQKIENCKNAIKMLDEHEYRVDERPEQPATSSFVVTIRTS